MSLRITYWTGVWDPGHEALSKEVDVLRRASGRPAPVVSFSRGQRSDWRPRGGVIRLSMNRPTVLRALAAVLEPRGDVNHVFGTASEWHFLRYLGRRPLVFTVAIPGVSPDPTLFEKVTTFAAESHALAASLLAAGAPPERVRVVYPGVDLREFAPSPLPEAKPFRILFASTPADVHEFEPRGIHLLIEAARALPEVEFVLLWRQWGNTHAAQLALQALRPPDNLKIERGPASDMASQFARAHATACCFADGFGKSCPNSVVESLACGRPALLADTIGIAPLVADRGAGAVVPRTVEGLVNGVERLRRELDPMSRVARLAAEQLFDVQLFRATYYDLYERARRDHAMTSAVPTRGRTVQVREA